MIGKRHALGLGAYIDHAPAWIPAEEAERAFANLRDELTWEAREIVLFGRRILQPRLVAWAGDLPYRYSGQTLPPRPFTSTVQNLLTRVRGALGVAFNHVLANHYRTGEDSMGMHADAESELGLDPVVATLSFGAERRLRVVPRKGVTGDRHEFTLRAGDLLVMGGTCQRFFLHGIPRAPAGVETSPRISLTLREVKTAPPGDRTSIESRG